MFKEQIQEKEFNQINSEKSKERDRRMELIEKHHGFAVAAYKLEQCFSENSEISEEELQEKLADIPENLKNRFEHAISNYRRKIEKMRLHQAEIEEIIERNCQYGIPRLEMEKEFAIMLWRGIANGMMNTQPLGEVSYEMREGYMIMYFERVEDYQRAKKKKEFVNMHEIESSAGCYIKYAHIRTFREKYYAPLLLVRKDQNRTEEIVKHERQHYINDQVLDNFTLIEKSNDLREDEKYEKEKWDRDKRFRDIKDEVISYIRDGGIDYKFSFKHTLHEELYQHLYVNMSQEDLELVDKILQQLDEFFEEKRRNRQLKNDHWRAILTYQLVSVPLLKFPHWLKALDDYYSKRYNLLERFGLNINQYDSKWGKNDWQTWVFMNTYPAPYQEYMKKNKEQAELLVKRIESLEEEALDAVFNQELNFDEIEALLSKIKIQYDEVVNEFSALCEPLKKDGALLPNASTPESYEYGEDWLDSVNDKSDFLLGVQSELLNAIAQYPQVEIDRVIKSVCTNHVIDGAKISEKKFVKFLKKIVHTKNNSRACAVDIGEEETFPHTVYVHLDFLVSPEENKRGVKGASIVITIHSSEFKME